MIDQLFNKKLINNYLARNNMRVEYFKDIQKLKDIIENIPKDDYPYQWDAAFNAEYLDTNDYFCLTLYQDNKLIGTYAARHMAIDSYMKEIRDVFNNDNVAEKIEFELLGIDKVAWYSSLQWISRHSRGSRIGVFLDYIKKSLVFEKYNANFNYAIHKQALLDYHLKKLQYNQSEWLMTVEKGNIGGAGGPEDKVYYLCNANRDSWLSKQNELYNNL
jgi:hypothetical protein